MRLNTNTDITYEKEESKFKITRGMIILASIILIVIAIVVIVLVVKSNEKKEKTFTQKDFAKLESRMLEEIPFYIQLNNITLTEETIRIDLEKLLIENGGTIDKGKVKAARICEGYINAYLEGDIEVYFPYIKCNDLYTTEGYEEEEKTPDNSLSIIDEEKPNLILNGDEKYSINIYEEYNELGYKAIDNIDGDITSKVEVKGEVNTYKNGIYKITYSITDKAGNKTVKTREITVVGKQTTTKLATTTKKQAITTTKKVVTTKKQTITTKKTTTKPVITTKVITTTKRPTTTKRVTTPPVITLYGSKAITIYVGDTYKDPGYSATDALGNSITSSVVISGKVNTSYAGTYYINYSVTDKYGNKTVASRTVVVKNKVIEVTGISVSPSNLTLNKGESKALSVYISPSNATNKTVTWTSSNNNIVTVSSNGVVKGLVRGVTTITATTSNKLTYTIRVEVK